MTLPTDITRCLDDFCPERERCERWLQRGSPPSLENSLASLFPYNIALDEPCPYRIAPGEDFPG